MLKLLAAPPISSTVAAKARGTRGGIRDADRLTGCSTHRWVTYAKTSETVSTINAPVPPRVE